MRTKHDIKWLAHYNELRIYLEEHHQLPDKKRTENRALLNWWKYNKKLFKAGRLTEERLKLLHQLNELRHKKILEILKSASNLNGNLNCSKELEHYAS